METCKAVVQEGKRKGETCKFPPGENGYCGRHQRNKTFDDGILEGKKWCRFFFRGCNSDLTGKDDLACETCRNALNKKQNSCKHEGCPFKVKEGKYCKKHERDVYYDEEKEKNIKYCDIARGCFTILTTNKKSCEKCLEKFLKKDIERYNKRKNIIVASQQVGAVKRTCVTCQTDFDPYKTKFLKESIKCKVCAEKQAKQDKKREDRVRNYKEEHFRNLEMYYKNYIEKANIREKGDFQIEFETFTELVKGSCYYCKYKSDTETNGIDRINNDIGYIKENCVTACWKCNRMKHFYHPRFFIEKCKIICKQTEPTKEFYKEWKLYYSRTSYHNFKAYKREAEQRELPFELSEEQWSWLSKSACYLCGYQSMYGIGIDRVDNTIRKYSIDNCRPCCGSCNSMKNELTLKDFIEQCELISNTWSLSKNFTTIPVSKNPLKETGETLKERKHWKAASLYSAIISDSALEFWNSYSEVFTENEYDILCLLIKKTEKALAIDMLKTLITKLKKRKIRLNAEADV